MKGLVGHGHKPYGPKASSLKNHMDTQNHSAPGKLLKIFPLNFYSIVF